MCNAYYKQIGRRLERCVELETMNAWIGQRTIWMELENARPAENKRLIMEYLPRDDGITHINIYSRGKTLLGKMLSNFADVDFKVQGISFASVEAFWYWVQLDLSECGEMAARQLRNSSGYQAKKIGKQLVEMYGNGIDTNSAKFKTKIFKALEARLEASRTLQSMLRKSDLPFAHYYVFDDKQVQAGFGWVIDWWTEKRKELQSNS